MTMTGAILHSGGCQCGRVRYAIHAEPVGASVCHCRMCQKAFGNFFAPFVTVKAGDLRWTKEAPTIFMSSEIVERGFCATCGTPLSFRFTDRDTISVSHGSLDRPERIRPTATIGVEGQLPWLHDVLLIDGTTTEARVPAERLAQLSSRQHPDG
jgi:hypothetical protein